VALLAHQLLGVAACQAADAMIEYALRADWTLVADSVVLDGIGHYPQLDVPLDAAELITGFTSRG
jgi:hypothetical protein